MTVIMTQFPLLRWWFIVSYAVHILWMPVVQAISCYECKGQYDGSTCGRLVRDGQVSVPTTQCRNSNKCKTTYESYGNGSVSYVRGCPEDGHCEERFSSKVSWSDPENTGRAIIVRCCDTNNCNNWLKEQRCYECGGNTLDDCPIVASNRMATKLCNGYCTTLYNYTKSTLRVERGCGDMDCDARKVKTFDPNSNSQVSRTCCLGDVCNRQMEVFQCYECSGFGENSDCGRTVGPSATKYLEICPEPNKCFCETQYWRNTSGIFYERRRRRDSCSMIRRDSNLSDGVHLTSCCSSHKCNGHFTLYQGEDSSEEDYLGEYGDYGNEISSAFTASQHLHFIGGCVVSWLLVSNGYRHL